MSISNLLSNISNSWSNIFAKSVTCETLNADVLNVDVLNVDQLNVDQLNANQITATQVTATQVTADNFVGGNYSGSEYTGTDITAVQFNGTKFAGGIFVGDRLSLSSQPGLTFSSEPLLQVIPTSTDTKVQLYSTILYAVSGIAANSNTFTIYIPGLYFVSYNILCLANSNPGYRSAWVSRIPASGSDNIRYLYSQIPGINSASEGVIVNSSGVIYLQEFDSIEFYFYQNSSADLTIGAGVGFNSIFSIVKLY